LGKHLKTIHGLKVNTAPNPKQTLISSHFENLSSSQENKITQRLIEWIVKSQRPISIVEDDGFLQFIKELNPKYPLPSRKKIKALVKEKYCQIKEKVLFFSVFSLN
jgi:hypothetical protein